MLKDGLLQDLMDESPSLELFAFVVEGTEAVERSQKLAASFRRERWAGSLTGYQTEAIRNGALASLSF